ncbi:hypothetical protein ONS95_009011 [Cadophora gregata]|uniref:uncharacterized protein n=1 Tax=Cadophora gregata TaxID=51156 RepID=UPI0026DB3D88|nr:uncharacterized protein ONS95_009011 [Cadophora gregata]KAK0124025.1 hypothetical protein ONS95_009011 [Cadophora gregata]
MTICLALNTIPIPFPQNSYSDHPFTEAVLAKYFGSDVTPNAIQLQINRNVQPTAKKVREFADGGGDPKDLNIGGGGDDDGKGGKRGKEMVKYFGTDVTPGSLQVAVCRHVTPLVKKVKDHANSGGDCKNLNLVGDVKTGKGQISAMLYTIHVFLLFILLCIFCPGIDVPAELAKHFGSDTTQGGIAKMFSRHILPQAKLVRDCVQSGGDPKDLSLGGDVKDTPGKGGKKGQTMPFQHLHSSSRVYFFGYSLLSAFYLLFLLLPICFHRCVLIRL